MVLTISNSRKFIKFIEASSYAMACVVKLAVKAGMNQTPLNSANMTRKKGKTPIRRCFTLKGRRNAIDDLQYRSVQILPVPAEVGIGSWGCDLYHKGD